MRALLLSIILLSLCRTLAVAQAGFVPRLSDDRAARASSSNKDPDANGDSWSCEPGETRTLADLKGPGQINHIWMTISSDEPAFLRRMVLRIYWDGEKTPSVEAPVGDFFGLGHAQYYQYDCAVFSIGDRMGLNCYWPMPFARSARVTITNEGTKGVGVYFYVDWVRKAKADPGLGYFHAQYRQFNPPPRGRDMTFLEARGKGLFVGCNYTVFATTGDWWGEGDDKFYIDDQGLTLKGTGTEDYFCGGWGFPTGPYAHLYTGVPLNGMNRDQEITNCYRYHLADPIPFARSLRFDMEHKGAGIVDGKQVGYMERFDFISEVSYWYQAEPHAAFPTLPPVMDRLLDYQKRAYVEPDAFEVELYTAFLTVEGAPSSALAPERMARYGNGWSSGEQATFAAPGPGARIVFPADPFQGLAGVVFALTTGPDYGQVALKQGDQVLATFDGYSATVQPGKPITVTFTRPLLQYPLTLEVTGKAAASAGYRVGLDYVKPVLAPGK